MNLRITGASLSDDAGVELARIESIKVGGGTAGRMDPQGNIVRVTDPLTEHYHVRLLSQAGNMIPDELVLVDTYDEAVALAEAFGTKVAANAGLIAQFREAMEA